MNYAVKGTDLESIADAIRTKGGTSADIAFPAGFVEAIGNISGGGGTLITKSITANGTYNASSDNADGYSSVTVAVPSKLVTGTFTGTTADGAMDVTIPYSGSGYPVAAIIYPSYGPYKPNTDWYTTIQKSAVGMWAMVKADISTTPTYSADSSENFGYVLSMYKSNDTDAAATSGNRAANSVSYRNTNASSTYGGCAKFRSATTLSVYIAGASYGFMKDVEYTYQIIYSEAA